jgi:hypothetical protein
MFRFSIRELMLVTLVAALGVAWFAEHRRAQSALERAKDAEETAEVRWHYWKKEVADIQKQLPQFGLDIGWIVHGGPHVYKISENP